MTAKTTNEQLKKSAEQGTKPGERRVTYLVRNIVDDKIREIAHQDNVNIKDVVNDAFEDRIQKWEKKNGKLTPPRRN
jgi:hypothetical protein